jgi:hypothetical protein
LKARQWLSIGLGLTLFAASALAQSQQSAPSRSGGQQSPSIATAPDSVLPGDTGQTQTGTGSVSGTVIDQTGTAVSGAHVTLTIGNVSTEEVTTDEDGQFFFVNVNPGSFRLSVTASGFETQTVSGTLSPGEAYLVPKLTLALVGVSTEVRVMPTAELAEVQIRQQEKQRVLGVPNFYVTYASNAAPLDVNQKFQLAWHSSVDPVTFGLVAATAGIQQAADQYTAFGQGAAGYGRRFGAAYGDAAISTFLGGAILPSIFKQDPRFFFKETGTKKQRVLYAVAAAVMCKGDNGHWQPNYSGILGSLAAGGISNLYYPPQNRDDLAVTLEGTAIGIGATAGANILQEFVVPKLTRKKSSKADTSTQP